MPELEKYDALEKEARAWALVTKRDMLTLLASFGLDEKIKVSKTLSRVRIQRSASTGKAFTTKEDFLYKSLSYKIRKSQGFLESVGFVFARHGIFLEHGVGRGRPVGSSQAEAAKQPWLLRVLPGQIEELADILEERYADIAANELRFLIPGIIDTKITR